MKRTSFLSGIIFIMIFMALTGCKKDKTEINELVVIKRSTGVLYIVNKIDGTLTQKMTITIDDSPLINLRSLVYDPASGKCFAGSTASGNGKFYSIDLETGVATLLNGNINNDWDGIADLVIASDGNILAEIYSNIEDNSALVTFNKTSGEEGSPTSIMQGTTEIITTGGLTYGNSGTQLILGGNNEIYVSDMAGSVYNTIPLTGTDNIDDNSVYVMDMEKDHDGSVFGLVYESNDQDQYLIKINISTGELSEIKLLASGNNTALYHCLAFIPESKLQ